jgi:uncharacterized membrane protein YdcZ (DUF606 family)
MNIDPDLAMALCLILAGAIIVAGKNLAERIGRIAILGRLSTTTCRWVGGALIATAIVIIFATSKIEDTPGPMVGSKPEFTFFLGTPFLLASAALAAAGTLSLASSFRAKT